MKRKMTLWQWLDDRGLITLSKIAAVVGVLGFGFWCGYKSRPPVFVLAPQHIAEMLIADGYWEPNEVIYIGTQMRPEFIETWEHNVVDKAMCECENSGDRPYNVVPQYLCEKYYWQVDGNEKHFDWKKYREMRERMAAKVEAAGMCKLIGVTVGRVYLAAVVLFALLMTGLVIKSKFQP